MAAEAIRIEVNITGKDNMGPSVESSKSKISAFDKSLQKTERQLQKLDRNRWQVALEAVDKVTHVISTVGGAVRGFVGKVWNVTIMRALARV